MEYLPRSTEGRAGVLGAHIDCDEFEQTPDGPFSAPAITSNTVPADRIKDSFGAGLMR